MVTSFFTSLREAAKRRRSNLQHCGGDCSPALAYGASVVGKNTLLAMTLGNIITPWKI